MAARAGYSVRTISDLRAIPATALTQDSVRFVGEKETLYYFAPGATGADDGDLIIAPSFGAGRWKKSASGNPGGGSDGDGGGEPNPDITDLQNRVTTLEGQAFTLDSQVSALSTGKVSSDRFKFVLENVLEQTQSSYDASGIYDSGTDTSTFYAPGFDTAFFFVGATNLGGSVGYLPTSIEYVPVASVPSGYEIGTNDHLKLTVSGNVATLRIYLQRVLGSGILNTLIEQYYSASLGD